MSKKYEKRCLLRTDFFSIYYGKGVYLSHEQREFLHHDADITVTYIINGEGTVKVEGKSYSIRCEDMIIMNASEIHCSEIKDGTFHERISVCIDTTALRRLVKDADTLLGCFYDRGKGCDNVLSSENVNKYGLGRLALDILSLLEKEQSQSVLLCSLRVLELLIRINEVFAHARERYEEHTTENPMIAQVIAFIDEQFQTIENSEQIAKKFFVSKYYLEHLFREHIGISMWNYIILKRLLYVNELLKVGYSSKAAATLAGFSNYSNFFRLYKKHMSMTPKEYRNRIFQKH